MVWIDGTPTSPPGAEWNASPGLPSIFLGSEGLVASGGLTIGAAVATSAGVFMPSTESHFYPSLGLSLNADVAMAATAGSTVAGADYPPGGAPSGDAAFYAYDNVGYLTTSSAEADYYSYENVGALTTVVAEAVDEAYESVVAGTGDVGFYVYVDVPKPPIGIEGNDEFYFYGNVGLTVTPNGDAQAYWYEVVALPIAAPDVDVPIFGTFESATLNGLAIRITELDNAGQPTSNVVVSNSFSAITFTPQYTDSQEIVVRNGQGVPVGTVEVPGVLERITLSVDICGLDGDLRRLLGGGDPLSIAPAELSWAAPSTDEPSGVAVAIELWTTALSPSTPDGGSYPYYRWVFPYVEMGIDASDHLIQDGLLATRCLGDGWGNDAFGTGPSNDWSFVSNRPYQYARDTSVPAVAVMV